MERTQVDSIVDLAADLAGKADQVQEVLVIYSVKGESEPRVLDNGLSVETGVFMCEWFKNWLLSRMSNPKNSG